jgi:mannose-1-phosphate guanylyltransferase
MHETAGPPPSPPLFALIMAGGTGTRLWPYSRRWRPKQLLALLGEDTMLQATVARLEPQVPPERVIVLTNVEHVDEVRAQLPRVPPENVVGEPAAFGTAPAVALGAAIVRGRFSGGVVVCLPADHAIEPAAGLQETIAVAGRAAGSGYLVTIGIRPTSPATGLGYIRVGGELPDAPGAYGVVQFVEKPDRDVAARYFASGEYLWNAGMFIWDTATVFELYRHLLPDLGAQMETMAELASRADFGVRLPELWKTITDRTTVDYGIVERADRVACVPAQFHWDDVGSWSALAAVLAADESGNVVVGRHIDVDSRDCIVRVAAPWPRSASPVS